MCKFVEAAAVFTMSFMVRGMQVALVAQSTVGEKRGAATLSHSMLHAVHQWVD